MGVTASAVDAPSTTEPKRSRRRTRRNARRVSRDLMCSRGAARFDGSSPDVVLSARGRAPAMRFPGEALGRFLIASVLPDGGTARIVNLASRDER